MGCQNSVQHVPQHNQGFHLSSYIKSTEGILSINALENQLQRAILDHKNDIYNWHSVAVAMEQMVAFTIKKETYHPDTYEQMLKTVIKICQSDTEEVEETEESKRSSQLISDVLTPFFTAVIACPLHHIRENPDIKDWWGKLADASTPYSVPTGYLKLIRSKFDILLVQAFWYPVTQFTMLGEKVEFNESHWIKLNQLRMNRDLSISNHPDELGYRKIIKMISKLPLEYCNKLPAMIWVRLRDWISWTMSDTDLITCFYHIVPTPKFSELRKSIEVKVVENPGLFSHHTYSNGDRALAIAVNNSCQPRVRSKLFRHATDKDHDFIKSQMKIPGSKLEKAITPSDINYQVRVIIERLCIDLEYDVETEWLLKVESIATAYIDQLRSSRRCKTKHIPKLSYDKRFRKKIVEVCEDFSERAVKEIIDDVHPKVREAILENGSFTDPNLQVAKIVHMNVRHGIVIPLVLHPGVVMSQEMDDVCDAEKRRCMKV